MNTTKLHFAAIFTIATLAFTARATSQIKVYEPSQASNIKAGEGGIYCLPATKILIELTFTKREYQKGDLFDKTWLMANKTTLKNYLDYQNLIPDLSKASPKITYKLLDKNISLKSAAIGDPNKVYFVQVNKKAFKKSNIKLTYGTDYLLNGVSQETENKTFEIITKIATTSIGAVSSLLTGRLVDLSAVSFKSNKNFQAFSVDLNKQGVPEFTIRDKKSSISKADEQRDKLLEELINLENIEKDLLVGDKSVEDSSLLAKYLENINSLKKKIITVIGYDYEEKTMSAIFEVFPASGMATYQLFRFSAANGLIPLNSPIQLGVRHYKISNPNGTPDGSEIYNLYIVPETNILLPVSPKPKPEDVTNFYRYNIPVKANIAITKNNSTEFVTNSNMIIPQYGSLGYVKTLIAKNSFDVDGITGALKSLSIERTPRITSDKIDNADKLLEKIKTSTDKSQQEIDQLKKQKEKLELLEAIRKLTNSTPEE